MVEALQERTSSPSADRRTRRREAILAAARRLFLDKGFDAVSMGEIVRASGGSLSTLYDMFESKEGVLVAIVTEDRRETLALMRGLIDHQASPRETIAMLVNDLQAEFFQSDMIGMLRLVMTETMRNADLARLLRESAFTPLDDLLIALFRRWTDEGKARIDRPDIAVDLLMGMMIHPRLKHACYGSSGMPDGDQIASAEAAIAMFTSHYGIA